MKEQTHQKGCNQRVHQVLSDSSPLFLPSFCSLALGNRDDDDSIFLDKQDREIQKLLLRLEDEGVGREKMK
jgi:hypothetical protein